MMKYPRRRRRSDRGDSRQLDGSKSVKLKKKCPRCEKMAPTNRRGFCKQCAAKYEKENGITGWAWSGGNAPSRLPPERLAEMKTRTFADMTPEERAEMQRLYGGGRR